jgi:tetratricopeptide (TPR) repeat protein
LGPRSLSPGTLASEQLKLERSVLVPPVTGSAVAASSPSTSEPSAPGSAEAAANAASDAAADRTLELLAERCTSSSSLLDRSLLDESTPVTTGVLTHSRVNEKAKERIRQATTLASRGATYAARVELLSALRMLTQAADKDLGAAHRTVALAAGLRALEEASDFTAHGVELDADLNVAVIVASHRTPIAKSREACELMPQLAADLYYRYAQKQLGESVLGSPAGSMALYALGKLNSQLSAVEPQQSLDADRQAFAFQQAALIARRDNDMAAHELGVLMAEAGHYPEASVLLDQVARRQPHPTVLQNLACVQRHLGRHAEAEALQQQAAMLASAPGNTGMLQWLSPEAFAETAQATPVPIRTAHQPVPLAATPPVPR